VDAGHSFIGVDNNGRPDTLLMMQESFDFGRPDDATRQQTGEIAREVLGAGFRVIAE
jgi:hypothetical protein